MSEVASHPRTFVLVLALLASGTAAAQCPFPGMPSFPLTSDSIVSGQSYSVNWTAAPTLRAGGQYIFEASATSDFSVIELRLFTSATSLSFSTRPASSPSTLYLRVRAQQPCGTVGLNSAALVLQLAQAPAKMVITTSGPSWVVPVGSAAPTAVVVLKNIGGTTGTVSLTASDSFFSVTPTSLTLAPGAVGRVTLKATASLATVAFYTGRLFAALDTATVSTPVLFFVTPTPPADIADLSLKASISRVFFAAPSGKTPASQTVTLTLSKAMTGVYLAPRVGPGGTWLSLDRSQFEGPVPPSGQLTLTLAVDRTKRSAADGPAPVRTYLHLHPAGGPDDLNHSAIVEIVDSDTPTITVNAGPKRPAGRSFILPTTVKAQGQANALFFSDGWIRNSSPFRLPVNLFFTPDGKDGTSDPGVLESSLFIDGGSMMRTSDLVGSLFGTTGTGLVEVRSTVPEALTVRSTVESLTGGDPTTRYGTEIPIAPRGDGTGVGLPDLFVPGIEDDAARRANLILSETSGASVTVAATVYDSSGAVVGTLSRTLLPFSKTQVNGLVSTVAPGAAIAAGSVVVHATGGTGRAIALVTVIDNRSNSFSAIPGRPLVPPPTARRAFAPKGAIAVAPSTLIVPSAARLTGAYDTHYSTSLSVINGTATAAALTVTYNYIDVADGNTAKTLQKTTTIPPRGALAAGTSADVIANLFGLTTPTYGWMTIDGGTDQVIAVAGISAAVDPNDSSKGVKTAQVDSVTQDSSLVLGADDPENRFTGVEKSDERRSNLILVETGGATGDVLVRLFTPTGDEVAERTFPVTPGQYLQINDLFSDAGLGVGDGPFQNMEVSVQVTSGSAKVIGLATVIDNVSRSPEIFTLQPPGTPPPSIGF